MSGARKQRWGAVLVVLAAMTAPAVAGAGTMRISGVTEAVRDITMSVPEEGVVSAIKYDVGARVGKGKAIVILDSRRQELEKKRRRLIWESKVELEAAAKRAETLRKVAETSEQLFESTHSLSEEEVDRQRLEYQLAAAERDRLAVEEDREELEYRIAVENYERRIIRAPIDGVVVKLERDVGEYVEPGQPLLEIVDPKQCYLVCQLEERLGRSLKKGDQVDIELRAAGAPVRKKGRVVFASPVVDQASGLFEVRVEFANKDGKIRPGVPGTMLLTVADSPTEDAP